MKDFIVIRFLAPGVWEIQVIARRGTDSWVGRGKRCRI
jgi:hypothetical protein